MPTTVAERPRVRPTRESIDFLLRDGLGRDYSPEQEDILYCEGAREIIVAGGERGGKSLITSDCEVGRFPFYPVVWLCGDDYSTPKQEFDYIASNLAQLGLSPDVRWHDSDMSTIRFRYRWAKADPWQDYIIKTRSLLKWLKIAQEAPDHIILCEAGRCAYSQYQRLVDRTAEKRATLFASGTFESSLGWYPEKWNQGQIPGSDIKSFSLPSWSNLHVFPGGREDPEILRLERKHSRDHFMERFGGVPSPPRGLVFPEFRSILHVRELEIQDAPIELWIDPGYAGAYAVEVVQVINDRVYVVDEVYEQGLVTEEIIDICNVKPWWGLVKSGVVDIAARQHQAMPAVIEVWQDKAKLSLATNRVEEAEGRERLHTFLKPNPITMEPALLISERCTGLVSEFGGCPSPFRDANGEKVYAPYKWKEDRHGNIIGNSPEDKNNHGIKAVIYGLINRFGYVTRNTKVGQRKSSNPFN